MDRPSVIILDVGHGNSTVLLDTNGIVAIDAGPGTTLLEFLMQEEITRIDVLLVSHADKDHIEGLIGLIESELVEIGRVRLNTDLQTQTKLWEQLNYLLDTCHKKNKIDFDVALTTRNTGEFDQGRVQVEILAPSLRVAGTGVGSKRDGKRQLKTNTVSAVIRLKMDDDPRVLLCGDLDDSGLTEMLNDFPEPRAAVLVFPHHGGRAETSDMASFTKKLCGSVQPSTVIFSIGRGVHSTPIPEVVDAVRERGSAVRVACTQLSEYCAADAPASAPDHLLPIYASGKDKAHCCMGSIMIPLHDVDASPHPLQDDHVAFIDANVATALCRR